MQAKSNVGLGVERALRLSLCSNRCSALSILFRTQGARPAATTHSGAVAIRPAAENNSPSCSVSAVALGTLRSMPSDLNFAMYLRIILGAYCCSRGAPSLHSE